MNKTAVLLANLGSPDEANTPAVRRYLNQFLMDPAVLQLPWLVRRLIVSIFVLPKRPAASAEAYQQVWMEQGSPLVVLSKHLLGKLQEKSKLPIAMSMRYGNPSIKSQLLSLVENNKHLEEILFIPLYPHYAESTVGTSITEVKKVIKENSLKLRLRIIKPFYAEKPYINSLIESAKPWLEKKDKFDHVLFSYHGLPESHLINADSTKQHCLQSEACCSTPSVAHNTCYRHQVLETTKHFVEQAEIDQKHFSIAFQSRLGRAKWLEPSTESSLVALAQQGVKNLLVLCPAFVTDCLETLEEIEIRGSEIFQEAGGQSLTLIPCLNSNENWVDTLLGWTHENTDQQFYDAF